MKNADAFATLFHGGLELKADSLSCKGLGGKRRGDDSGTGRQRHRMAPGTGRC